MRNNKDQAERISREERPQAKYNEYEYLKWLSGKCSIPSNIEINDMANQIIYNAFKLKRYENHE